MFKNLTNFSYKRNWKEAIGFYLAFFLVCIILGAIAGASVGISGAMDVYKSRRAGTVVSVIFCLIVSGLLLKEKKLFKNFGYILLALLSGLLAVFGGSLLGLIIPAFMTTKESR